MNLMSIDKFDGYLLTNLFFNSMDSVSTTAEDLAVFRWFPFLFATTGELCFAFGMAYRRLRRTNN